jgi:hypothetical protein
MVVDPSDSKKVFREIYTGNPLRSMARPMVEFRFVPQISLR